MIKEKKFSALSAGEKAALVFDWLTEHKARDMEALEVKSALTDVAIIATASSGRHAKSLADGLLELCKEKNFEFLGMEGYEGGLWILVDLNDVIVHVFQESAREEYRLESLWREAEPLIMKNRSSSVQNS